MIGVLIHDSALYGYTGPGTTWANWMNLVRIMPLVQNRSLNLLISSPLYPPPLNPILPVTPDYKTLQYYVRQKRPRLIGHRDGLFFYSLFF